MPNTTEGPVAPALLPTHPLYGSRCFCKIIPRGISSQLELPFKEESQPVPALVGDLGTARCGHHFPTEPGALTLHLVSASFTLSLLTSAPAALAPPSSTSQLPPDHTFGHAASLTHTMLAHPYPGSSHFSTENCPGSNQNKRRSWAHSLPPILNSCSDREKHCSCSLPASKCSAARAGCHPSTPGTKHSEGTAQWARTSPHLVNTWVRWGWVHTGISLALRFSAD